MNFDLGRVTSPNRIEILEPGVSLERIGFRETEPKNFEADDVCALTFGEFGADLPWRAGEGVDSGVIFACNIYEQLTGEWMDLERFQRDAIQSNAFNPEEGSSLAELAKLLESYGAPSENLESAGLKDLMELLSDGKKIVCLVSELMLTHDCARAGMFLLPDGIIQLTAIDISSPDDVIVHYRSSSVTPGEDLTCNYERFTAAWDTSERYAYAFGN